MTGIWVQKWVDAALEACTKIDFKHAQQVVTDVITRRCSVGGVGAAHVVKGGGDGRLKGRTEG
jgi:hypothetical protein